MHRPYFENTPPYGQLICLPKEPPNYQVQELIEYSGEIIRIPIGRAWRYTNIIMELPHGVYELVPLASAHKPSSPTSTPPMAEGVGIRPRHTRSQRNLAHH